MGAQNSKESEVELQIDHPKFTYVKAITAGEKRTLRTVIGIGKRQYEAWKKALESSKVSHYHLLLPTREDFSSKGLCGDTGMLTLDYEDYPYLLSEEIYHRNGQKYCFQQAQIWFLIYNLTAAKRDFAIYSPKLGDIRPRNIFINKEGDMKISNLLSWPNEPTNDQKAFDRQITYLEAPQQVFQMANGSLESRSKHGQTELFSIGLTALSAAILKDQESLYSFDKGGYQFNHKEFERRVQEFKFTAYSQIFRALIVNLCSHNPQRRLQFDQFANWIDTHREKILNKRNFTITQCPPKLHQAVKELRLQGYGTFVVSPPNTIKSSYQSKVMEELVKQNVTLVDSQTSINQFENLDAAFSQSDPTHLS